MLRSEASAVYVSERLQIDKLKLTAQGKGAASERRRQQEIPDAQLLTRFQHTLAEHRQRKRARGTQEADVLGKLRDFKSKMKVRMFGTVLCCGILQEHSVLFSVPQQRYPSDLMRTRTKKHEMFYLAVQDALCKMLYASTMICRQGGTGSL